VAEGQTVGERIYLIREALGTRRDPMPLEEFARLIVTRTGASYDKSILSRMETGDRKVTLEDIEALAAVDPLKRGRSWLAFGEGEGWQGGKTSAPGPRTPEAVWVDDAPLPTSELYNRRQAKKAAQKKLPKSKPGSRRAVAV